MRVAKACSQCRALKRKCIAGSGTACLLCEQKGCECSFVTRRGQPRAGSLIPSVAASASTIAPDASEELIKLYFVHIHDRPHTLFHEKTVLAAYRQGRLPGYIVYPLLAHGARFSEDANVRQSGHRFALLGRQKLRENLERVSIENVQACILVGDMASAQGDQGAETLYFGTAVRMALLLRLNNEAPECDAIEREIRRRVWWSVYMIDIWSSAAVSLPRQLSELYSLSLPMSESVFQNAALPAYLASLSEAERGLGLWAHMTKLADLFAHVQKFHIEILSPLSSRQAVHETAIFIADKFQHYSETLPSDAIFTMANLDSHAAKGTGSTFLALHLGYHHYATLLYFHFLDEEQDSDLARTFAKRCKEHASWISDLNKISMEVPGCGTNYQIVGHLTAISSSVLLYILLFGKESELRVARERLEINFSKLMELNTWWPELDRIKQRLFVFQEACMWSVDPHTHVVDGWMVKFLLNHALPLPERYQRPQGESRLERDQEPFRRLHEVTERRMTTNNALSTLMSSSDSSGSGT